jgi:hypothetical protein
MRREAGDRRKPHLTSGDQIEALGQECPDADRGARSQQIEMHAVKGDVLREQMQIDRAVLEHVPLADLDVPPARRQGAQALPEAFARQAVEHHVHPAPTVEPAHLGHEALGIARIDRAVHTRLLHQMGPLFWRASAGDHPCSP